MIKISFIRKLPDGKYRVFSEKGKNLGTYPSLNLAKKRLRQIEFFKHKKSDTNSLFKIAKANEIPFTYSGVIRYLRKEKPELVLNFIKIFNQAFEEACQQEDDIEKIEKMCLLETVQKIDNG